MERKIRILHANTGLVAGGAERLIAEILPIMKGKGYEVEVLLLENKGNNIFEDELKKEDISVTTLSYNSKFDIRNLFAIRDIIKRFDIVHAHIFPVQYWIPLATIGLRNKPFIITTEHNTHNRRRDHRIFRFIERLIYSLYDKIISISPESEKNLLDWLKAKKGDKYGVVLNGINLQKFQNAHPVNLKQYLNIKCRSEDKFLLMVARFDEQKDHETLFRAIHILPNNIKLILIGEGELEHNYKKLAKSLSIDERIFFLGKRTDVPQITKSVDICVLSSNWEGFGLVAVEAMAAGKPVIASRVPGVENIVKDYGLLFEKGNYKELANHITNLLRDQNSYDLYSNKCLGRANDFDVSEMTVSYLQIYHQLLRGKNR